MNKIYNPKDIEQNLYSHWENCGYFKPSGDFLQNSYCIMVPPPNITGRLHMGHAFQLTVIDILIRYQRMLGKNTLCQFGTDHAGIATQMIVEHKIAAEDGKTRHDYGRDVFIDKIWKWKLQSGNIINNQIRRIGISVDWDRERFTMDDGLSNAVKEVFISLYQEGLIYRGKRLVNWDPKLNTAISDLEVEGRESKGWIWYLRYSLADNMSTINGLNYIIVATTRPETIFGDTGIAVNEKDPRYYNLIGQHVITPLTGRRIPIIGDIHADMTKGTGCVKITPAHDFKDYEVGKRHSLPMINIFTFDGKIRYKEEVFDTNGKIIIKSSSEIPEAFRGLDRFVARKSVVLELDRLGLLVKIQEHYLTIPYGDRSNEIIEPMLTDQWYLRVEPLAKVAIEAVEQGLIHFVPKQYEKMYFSWMNNIQDWCISRQLWWGHRIPAYYDNNEKIYVGYSEFDVRQKYSLREDVLLYQDEDILDTWFSSSLWTFSSLGWPKNIDFLHKFHPTNVIISGFDIIFFWIARMVMLTMHFIKDDNGKPQVPFKTIYITGLIRDEEGKKMSKSRGNVIDPLDIIDGISLDDLLKKNTSNMLLPHLKNKTILLIKKQFPNGIYPYGTDALRFTLASLASTSRDINWNMKRLEGYRNFCNKLWNASRFVLMNAKNKDCGFGYGDKLLSLADRWILTGFNLTVQKFCAALDGYRFDLATSILYDFIWNQFCDWYLEFTKSVIITGSVSEQRGTLYTLITVLEKILRLSHPIIPFITETIWQKLKLLTGDLSLTIMTKSFPVYNALEMDQESFIDLEWIKKIIIAVRNIRTEMNISYVRPLTLLLRYMSPKLICRINQNLNIILMVGKISDIIFLQKDDKEPVSVAKFVGDIELLIPLSGLFNKEEEIKRLTKEIKHIESEINRISKKLDNIFFISRAPEYIIIKERKKLSYYQKNIDKIIKNKIIISNL